jgi:hypothetical protein
MAKATLGGHPLLDGTVSWQLTAGVNPYITEFEVYPDAADALAPEGGRLTPVSLSIESPGAPGVTIDFLYVLQKRPSGNPNTFLVRVADRRWFWPFKHVDHEFNVRRNIGVKRVKAGFNPPELDPLEPKIRYAKWSLNNGYPWSAKQALEEVFETIKEAERETTGSAPGLEIDSNIGKLTGTTLPLEDLKLQDDGAAAFKRIMDFIPGAQVTVEPSGKVSVYSTATGAEKATLDELLPEQEGGGHAAVVANSRTRPREIRVYFAPEVELKFTHTEPAVEGGSVARTAEDPYTENVLPVPDYELSVPGIGKVAQGTYITIGQALQAWGAVPGGSQITLEAVRRAMIPYLDLWTGVRIGGLGDDKADWASRIAALQTHFRRTYRINQNVVQRVRQFRAYRVATINPQTGSRAPALAYQDWSVIATQRFIATQLGGGADSFAYAENFDGYPAGGSLSGGDIIAAPIDVRVVDSDQGIVHLDFRADPYRTHEVFLPGKIDNIPTGKIKGGLVAWNTREGGQRVPELETGHEVVFVLTVIPASPNSKDRLFRLIRGPSDVKKLLPNSLQGGLSNANGPPMDVFIGPGWETARIAWVESKGTRIKLALGIGVSDNQPAIPISTLGELVINVQDQFKTGPTEGSLDAIANAVAASIYAEHADRMEGSRTSYANDAATVQGFIESVIHSVLPSGEATTSATVSERVQPLDMMSMMPTSTRAIILKLATSGKALQ